MMLLRFLVTLTSFIFVLVLNHMPYVSRAQCPEKWSVIKDYSSQTFQSVRGIHFFGQNGLAFLGSGIYLQTTDNGQTWNQDTLDGVIFGSEFVSQSTGWVVGDFIQQTTDSGQTWADKSPNNNLNYYGVDFINNAEGWIVGTGGSIMHTTNAGNTWKKQSSGFPERDLNDVFFINSDTGWIAGNSGIILKTTNGGNTWQDQSSGGSDFNAIHFISPDTGWVVGANGTILYTSDGGSSWDSQSSGTNESLHSVEFISPDTGWAVGGSGVVLHTMDGQKWNETVIDDNTLYDIHYNDSLVWCGGDGGIFKRNRAPYQQLITVQTCNSYTVPSEHETYYQSGFYYDTLSNKAGCDSVIAIDLTVHHATSTTINPQVCQKYTMPKSGATYFKEGTYRDTVSNQYNCDSVITVNLELKVDTAVVQTGDTLKAVQANASYQWLKCMKSGYKRITGAVNRFYEPTVKGAYAVAITNDGCTDTSECYKVSEVTVVKKGTAGTRGPGIYPNPVKKTLFITRINSFQLNVKILSLTGEKVAEFKNRHRIPVSGIASGIYFVKITLADGAQYLKRFVKE